MEPDFQSEYVSNIMPYSFEPTVNSVQSDTSDIIPSDSMEPVTENNATENDTENWCTCGTCQPAHGQVNLCCHKYSKVKKRLENSQYNCITEHRGFTSNCLDEYVLEASFYEYCQSEGPLGDGEMLHEVLRYISYRRFTRWIFQRLGARNRKQIPCCAVNAIRKRFPSNGNYKGFKNSVFD